MKKRLIKIPKIIILKCPNCSEKSKARVDIKNCPQSFTCPKCSSLIRNNLMNCCVICAFSSKKCPRTLYMEAKVKGLEIR